MPVIHNSISSDASSTVQENLKFLTLLFLRMKVVLRNRPSSISIPTPVVEGFCNTAEMRLKVLHAHLLAIKEKGKLPFLFFYDMKIVYSFPQVNIETSL